MIKILERLTILGCGSALPASGRNPTAQVLEHNGRYFLIDCGEGTQSRLRENKISFDKITTIFISHMHGDHYLGFPGLISTMQLLGRSRALDVYCPKGLQQIMELQFKLSSTWISFPLNFIEVNEEELLFDWDTITCESVELNHRIKCFGFLFKEKPKPRRINGIAVKEEGVPHFFMNKLREGDDFLNESGETISNSKLTLPPYPSYSYAFCSDNRVKSEFHKKIKGVSVLYHEATFLKKDLDRAKSTFHSTSEEAAKLAKEAGVEVLIVGHYSARYKENKPFKEEIEPIFKNCVLANERMVFDFKKLTTIT